MKQLFFLLATLLASIISYSQSYYYLRADTVTIEKVGANGELIIKNAGRDSQKGGVLFNLGGGRTAFKNSQVLNDSTIVIGGDTLLIKGGIKGGSALDTSSLSARIDDRVQYSDTLLMLYPYLRKKDSSSLSKRIDARLKYIDTALMLAVYLRASDTVSLSSRIDQRMKYTDTVSLSNRIDGKQVSGNYITALTGDAAASGPGSASITIANNAITDAKFRQSTANTLIGNPTGSTANVQDITKGFGLAFSGSNLNVDTSIGIATQFSTRKEQFLDSIYSKVGGFTGISEFIDNSSGYAVSGGNLVFSSGAGNFSKTLDLKVDNIASDHYTMLNHWKITAGFIVTASSTGAGIGLNSCNTFFPHYTLVQFNTSNNHFVIWVDGSPIIDQASAFSWSTNDSIEITYERRINSFIASIRNVTTNSAPSYINIDLGFGGSSLPNTGRFSLFNIGGGFKLYKWQVTSTESKNVEVMCVGDSKTAGYNATYAQYAFPYLLSRQYSVCVEAGPADITANIVQLLPEIVTLNPRQVLLCVGVNDISFGVSSATWHTNLATIVNTLTAAGIRVVIINSLYDITSAPTLAAYINANFPSSEVIDCFSAGNRNGTLAGDNVHPTDFGHRIAYETIVYSGKLLYGDVTKIKDSLFNNTRTTNNIYTGTATAPSTISAGDIIMPTDGAITSWASATNKRGRIIPFASSGAVEYRNYHFGVTGEGSHIFYIPNGSIGTQRIGFEFLNNGEGLLLGTLFTGFVGTPVYPTGFTAAHGDIIMPVDGMIGATTGGANQRGTFMPFSNQGVSEYRNYYFSANTHKSHAWYTPNGSTNTQQASLYLTDDAKVHIPVKDSTGSPANMAWIDPSDGAIKVAAVPSGGVTGSGTSGRLAYWNGSSSLTSDGNGLYSSSNNGTLSIGTTNTQGHLNIAGDKTFGSSGIQSYFGPANYNDNTTSASGTSSNFSINYIGQPTITATNLNVTFPNIWTLYLEKPLAGTNATITRAYSLYCDGPVKFKQSIQHTYTVLAANTTVDDTYSIVGVSAGGGNVTITLPSASTYPGIEYTFKRTDATGNTCTIAGTIDGTSGYTLTAQYKYITVISNGTDWYIISSN